MAVNRVMAKATLKYIMTNDYEGLEAYICGMLHEDDENHELMELVTTELETVHLTAPVVATLPARMKTISPFLLCAVKGRRKMLEFFVMNSVSPNFQTKQGITPLQMSAFFGHADAVETLLGYKADVHLRDSLGNTALFFAAAKGNTQIVNMLLKENDDINVQNKMNNTPLHAACMCQKPDMVSFLLLHGANEYIANDVDQTPVDVAVAMKHADVIGVFQDFRNGVLTQNSFCESSPDSVSDNTVLLKSVLVDVSKLRHWMDLRLENNVNEIPHYSNRRNDRRASSVIFSSIDRWRALQEGPTSPVRENIKSPRRRSGDRKKRRRSRSSAPLSSQLHFAREEHMIGASDVFMGSSMDQSESGIDSELDSSISDGRHSTLNSLPEVIEKMHASVMSRSDSLEGIENLPHDSPCNGDVVVQDAAEPTVVKHSKKIPPPVPPKPVRSYSFSIPKQRIIATSFQRSASLRPSTSSKTYGDTLDLNVNSNSDHSAVHQNATTPGKENITPNTFDHARFSPGVSSDFDDSADDKQMVHKPYQKREHDPDTNEFVSKRWSLPAKMSQDELAVRFQSPCFRVLHRSFTVPDKPEQTQSLSEESLQDKRPAKSPIVKRSSLSVVLKPECEEKSRDSTDDLVDSAISVTCADILLEESTDTAENTNKPDSNTDHKETAGISSKDKTKKAKNGDSSTDYSDIEEMVEDLLSDKNKTNEESVAKQSMLKTDDQMSKTETESTEEPVTAASTDGEANIVSKGLKPNMTVKSLIPGKKAIAPVPVAPVMAGAGVVASVVAVKALQNKKPAGKKSVPPNATETTTTDQNHNNQQDKSYINTEPISQEPNLTKSLQTSQNIENTSHYNESHTEELIKQKINHMNLENRGKSEVLVPSSSTEVTHITNKDMIIPERNDVYKAAANVTKINTDLIKHEENVGTTHKLYNSDKKMNQEGTYVAAAAVTLAAAEAVEPEPTIMITAKPQAAAEVANPENTTYIAKHEKPATEPMKSESGTSVAKPQIVVELEKPEPTALPTHIQENPNRSENPETESADSSKQETVKDDNRNTNMLGLTENKYLMPKGEDNSMHSPIQPEVVIMTYAADESESESGTVLSQNDIQRPLSYVRGKPDSPEGQVSSSVKSDQTKIVRNLEATQNKNNKVEQWLHDPKNWETHYNRANIRTNSKEYTPRKTEHHQIVEPVVETDIPYLSMEDQIPHFTEWETHQRRGNIRTNSKLYNGKSHSIDDHLSSEGVICVPEVDSRRKRRLEMKNLELIIPQMNEKCLFSASPKELVTFPDTVDTMQETVPRQDSHILENPSDMRIDLQGRVTKIEQLTNAIECLLDRITARQRIIEAFKDSTHPFTDQSKDITRKYDDLPFIDDDVDSSNETVPHTPAIPHPAEPFPAVALVESQLISMALPIKGLVPPGVRRPLQCDFSTFTIDDEPKTASCFFLKKKNLVKDFEIDVPTMDFKIEMKNFPVKKRRTVENKSRDISLKFPLISTSVGNNWKALGRCLPITSYQNVERVLSDIDKNNANAQEKALQLLVTWNNQANKLNVNTFILKRALRWSGLANIAASL